MLKKTRSSGADSNTPDFNKPVISGILIVTSSTNVVKRFFDKILFCYQPIAANALSRSAMISSIFSRPTENLTIPPSMPAATSCSSVS